MQAMAIETNPNPARPAFGPLDPTTVSDLLNFLLRGPRYFSSDEEWDMFEDLCRELRLPSNPHGTSFPKHIRAWEAVLPECRRVYAGYPGVLEQLERELHALRERAGMREAARERASSRMEEERQRAIAEFGGVPNTGNTGPFWALPKATPTKTLKTNHIFNRLVWRDEPNGNALSEEEVLDRLPGEWRVVSGGKTIRQGGWYSGGNNPREDNRMPPLDIIVGSGPARPLEVEGILLQKSSESSIGAPSWHGSNWSLAVPVDALAKNAFTEMKALIQQCMKEESEGPCPRPPHGSAQRYQRDRCPRLWAGGREISVPRQCIWL